MVLRRSCAVESELHRAADSPERTYLRIAKPPKRNPIVRPTIPPIVAPILTEEERGQKSRSGEPWGLTLGDDGGLFGAAHLGWWWRHSIRGLRGTRLR